MRLCILTQYYPPEMGAPQARLSELAERLLDLGWQVEVLTALPNYPTGKVFPGYDPRRPFREKVGRIDTVRVPVYAAKGGFVRRLRCYFSFVNSAKRYGLSMCSPPDLLYVESPPLFIGYAARYLSKRWRCPFVFNVSDLWPDSAIRIGAVKKGLLTWMAERLELALYRESAGVTGQSEEIAVSVRTRSPGTRTEVITNGVDPKRFGRDKANESARAMLDCGHGPVFVYAGLLGLPQGLDQVIDIAKALPSEIAGRFVLVGEGPERERLQRRIEAESIKRVRIIGPVGRSDIPPLLAAADGAIITLGTSIPGSVPSKIYEAMASEIPVLLLSDGEAARRVTDAECGIAVPSNKIEEAKCAFIKLCADKNLRQKLGAAGRAAAEKVYNRDIIASRLDRFLRSTLQNGRN